MEEIYIIILCLVTLGLFNWFILNITMPILVKKSLETKLEQDNCPHKHTGYERGFGARPYRRCFDCDAIVEDE